jgi:chemotaxis protein CheD
MTSAENDVRLVHVIQGDYFVTDDENIVLTTILGSCVAACMCDPVAKIGGMNHFLLPDDGGRQENSGVARHGVHLMELLVNGLMQRGARRDRLQVKLFGGGKLFAGLTDIGGRNADFAEQFIRAEGFKYAGGNLRGLQGRRIRYWPITGQAKQIFIESGEVPNVPVQRAPVVEPASGSVELF